MHTAQLYTKKKKEKFSMFKCSTCEKAQEVWYYTKGGYCHEDIYTCLKCKNAFIVSAICDTCGTSHSRIYGCNNPDCDSEDYHYNRKEEEIEREF
ncbi:hypothetical protein MYX06_03455 [Patescibacteria group bacterium AH-259-L05]|nr:hypothetical protein [Patescibacteria group bacterium AH-259-L05]